MGCAKYVDELLLLFDGEDESLLLDSREDIRFERRHSDQYVEDNVLTFIMLLAR